jgi:hypothetical protein
LRHLIAATLLFATACSTTSDTTLDVTFDSCAPLVLVPADDSNADEIASVAAAADLWNRLGETQLSVEPVAGADRLEIHFQDAAEVFHGLYDDEHGVVYVNRDLVDEHARTVTVAHEVGHALGLWHVDPAERSSVMNMSNLDVEPNAGDRAALVGVWGDCSSPR